MIEMPLPDVDFSMHPATRSCSSISVTASTAIKRNNLSALTGASLRRDRQAAVDTERWRKRT